MTDSSTPPPYDLLAAAHDVTTSPEVRRSLVICSTPRSGSTLLAEAAYQTGLLGVPAEYLELGAALPYLFNRWECQSFNDYVTALHRRRTSKNGVFGLKVHWHQLLQFASVSQGAPAEAPVEFPVLVGVTRRVAPNPAFVYVTRRDKVRQAVSHWMALQTQQWIDVGSSEKPPTPPYDSSGIARMMAGIKESEASWTRFLSLGGVEPTNVVYEEFVADYAGTVERVAAALGVSSSDLSIPPPRMRKQSRSVNDEYAERYRQDTA